MFCDSKFNGVILPNTLHDIVFIDAPVEDDHLPETIRLLIVKFNDPSFLFTVVEIETLIDTINKKYRCGNQLCVYRDYLLISMNPSQPTDADIS